MNNKEQPEWTVVESEKPLMFSDSFLQSLKDEFPGVDVVGQLHAAHQFAEITFDSQLNKKGLVTFVTNWMRRNQKWAEANDHKFRECDSSGDDRT